VKWLYAPDANKANVVAELMKQKRSRG